jgi:hypothetical protein
LFRWGFGPTEAPLLDVPPRTRSLHRVLIPGCQGGRTLAAQPMNRRSVLTFALFALAARRLPLSAWTSRAEAQEKGASLVWRHGVGTTAMRWR